MTRRGRQTPSIFETLKDYIVPIIGGFLVILIIWSLMGGSEDTLSDQNTDIAGITAGIDFITEDTEAFIKHENEKREKITADASLSAGQTIIVKEGRVYLSPDDNNIIRLNKIAELEYVGNNNYSLYSSDAWIETENSTSLKMRYASLEIAPESIVSLTQNEAASTIYILRGSAKVSNLAGNKSSLGKGQKISISRQDTSKESIELSSLKKDIDSYFLGSDWFLDNDGQKVLSLEDSAPSEETGSGETVNETESEGISGDSSSEFVRFENLSDEAQTSQSQLSVKGNIISDQVVGLSIENISADIGNSKSFTVNSIPLRNKVNDLVVKVYGADKNVLEKKVFTVYTSKPLIVAEAPSSGGTETSSSQNTQTSNEKTNFAVDGSNFFFTAPSSTGKFTTTVGEVTIRGKTTAKNISKVTVNGNQLKSFNGSTWRYHAFERFKTIADGTNQYKINYYGKDGNLVYTDYFTIIKKKASAITLPQNTSTASPEASNEEENNQAETPENEIPEETLF